MTITTLEKPKPIRADKTGVKTLRLSASERGGYTFCRTLGLDDIYRYDPTDESRLLGHGGPYTLTVRGGVSRSCTCPARVRCCHMAGLDDYLKPMDDLYGIDHRRIEVIHSHERATKEARPELEAVRGTCPHCGEDMVSEVVYVTPAKDGSCSGYLVLWTCWGGFGPEPSCRYRRAL